MLRRPRGFSLLEVLLGSILFATVLVYLAGIWGVHARVIGHTRDRMVANFIAGQQMENCVTAGFRGVDLLVGPPIPETITTTLNGVSQEVTYVCTVQVANHSNPLLADSMKVVTVRVNFNELSEVGGKKEVVYRTILSDI
ncbi:hypothetical protein IV102_32720 [bacterium]|nr:hypothetical protein [bacterium]